MGKRHHLLTGLITAAVVQAQTSFALDSAIRYVVTPISQTLHERADINDFGQVALSGRLWTPGRRNSPWVGGTLTQLSQMSTVSEVTDSGVVLGTVRPPSPLSADDAYLRVWTPEQSNGSTGAIEVNSVLGQMRVTSTDNGDLIWGVRTLTTPFDIRLERWRRNPQGGFDRTDLGISVPLFSYVWGMESAGSRLLVSTYSEVSYGPNGRDSVSVVELSTGVRTVLRAGTDTTNTGYGSAINASGVVVGGTKQNTITNCLPLSWFPEGEGYREQALALASPDAYGKAFDINDSGPIVGWTSRQGESPVMWENDGQTLVRLDEHLEPHSAAGYQLGYAMAINSIGQIVTRSSFDHDDDPATNPIYGTVLLTPARLGDADVDQDIDFDDLLVLAQHYGDGSGATWYNGDFTGEGAVNFDDLLLLAQQYGFGSTGVVPDTGLLDEAFAVDFVTARELLPEPTALAALLGCAGRRRRDHLV